MKRFLLAVIAVIIFLTAQAQKIPLINSGEVIEAGKQLYDSGAYEAAISKYQTVPKRDTNYVYMLSELALAYIAHEQYDKAISTCDEALQNPSVYRVHLLKSKCIALDKKGSYDQSVALFTKSIEEYPFDHQLIYNLGITLYNHKEYDKAIDCFFRTLAISPFHAGSHLNLGRISIAQGRKTHGILALGMYMAVNNMDNSRLVQIDKFLSNEVAEEGTVKSTEVNAGEKMDQIIRSKIALDKNFKSKMPLDAPVVKQYEMFFQQLHTFPTTSNDRWINYYLPIYKAIADQKMIETFLYHILSSTTNDQIKKWRQKNEKELKKFYEVANREMSRHREWVTAPALGFSNPVQAWYDTNGKIEAIGQKESGDKRLGNWIYFHESMERSAEGKYNASGEKAGIWKYYYESGAVKSIENYETGEVTVFYESGPKHQHFFLKGDNIDGEVTLYHECGGVKEKLVYTEGQRHGAGVLYYPSGKKDVTYQYTQGKLTGDYLSYYENEILFSKSIYADGKLDGLYTEYYADGGPRITGAYVQDALHGVWKYYHNNGQLEKTGLYQNGNPIGEWKYYDTRGIQTEVRSFNAAGQWHGDNTFYHDGKTHYIKTFENDVLVKVVYVDKQGNVLGQFEGSNGTFTAKSYFAHGALSGEGAYKKGKMDGVWKHYYPEGSLLSEYRYVDGELQGEGLEYFRNGAKKFILFYLDDELHGYFTEFYSNGKIKYEGWYQHGEHQQQWLNYYADGTLQSDYYYLNDELQGAFIDYTAKGELFSVNHYENGRITNIEYFNSKGEQRVNVLDEGNKKIFEIKYPNGTSHSRYETMCGHYTGTTTKKFSDGHVYIEYPMMANRRHGKYTLYGLHNKPEIEGQYMNGNESGVWKWYFSTEKLDCIGKYVNGELDSTWTYYYPNGNISYAVNYQENKRHGITTINSAEGTPLLEKLYDHGNLISYRTLKPDGKFGDWVTFKRDASIVINYPNGVKAYEENFKDGLIEGPKRLYFSSGKLESEYIYKGGDYEGPFVVYYANGKIFEKGEYKNDELHGIHEVYAEDGSLVYSETHLMGTRHGKASVYSKGQAVKSVMYFGGAPE